LTTTFVRVPNASGLLDTCNQHQASVCLYDARRALLISSPSPYISISAKLCPFFLLLTMDEDARFANKGELEDWMKRRGVDNEKAKESAGKLFANGYDMPSTLVGASAAELIQAAKLSPPVARHLSNKLGIIDYWFLCKGVLLRPKSNAGGRFKLIELAKGGYYPRGTNVNEAFKVTNHATDPSLRLMYVSVVFDVKKEANLFIADVHSYVSKTQGVSLREDFQCTTIPSFDNPILVLESDYVPREAEGEAPEDSPVWNVELSAMDVSCVTSFYSYTDTVYKYQRIEEDNAFARCIPEGAHIFPKAKCNGIYEWLDDKDFNRLALSGPGHQQFDGTGRGRGKRARTNPMVTIEPMGIVFVTKDDIDMADIQVRLWCRNSHISKAWRPFLPNSALLSTEANSTIPRYDGLHIYCDRSRRHELIFEEETRPDGKAQRICVTAIPGVDDPSCLSTWDANTSTVAVYQIMEHLLTAAHADTLKSWSTEKG